ncbi:MAG TPA: hypothetical protein VHY82_12595 [Acetobacteraceae bacterium]|jgi:hypothetical protein|nr:hypothetical protein [Acetobacteraceae bacterium]
MQQPIRVLGLTAALAIALSGTASAAMYDGTYHGTLSGASGNAPSCARQAPAQITISNNRLEYVHMGHATITATVGADGSFSGSAQNTYGAGRAGTMVQTLDGKIAGGVVQAESKVGNSCTYKLELKRYS